MPKTYLLLLVVFEFAIASAPVPMLAQIGGNTSGSTVSGYGIDDLNTSSTINASYLNPASSPILDPFNNTTILNQLSSFPGTWVFAGTGDAMNIPAIPASDFNLVVYHPWVVNNNPFQNEIIGPDGGNWNRGVYNQDAGGADFLLQYTPHLPSDPTEINFIQGFTYDQKAGGQKFHGAQLDNKGSTTSPFYNGNYMGTFVNNKNDRSSPLLIPAGGSAYLLDIPYKCENGGGANCTNGQSNEEYLTFHTQLFQTWVEAATKIPGHGTENVLYGGVQWGYTYTNSDTAPGLYVVGSTDFVTEGQPGVSTFTVTNIGLGPSAITSLTINQAPTMGDPSDYANRVGLLGGTCYVGLILLPSISCTVDMNFITDTSDRGPLYDGITPFVLNVTLANGATANGAQLVVVSDTTPEPASLSLIVTGGGIVACILRRRWSRRTFEARA
jgi:hypothetical protein